MKRTQRFLVIGRRFVYPNSLRAIKKRWVTLYVSYQEYRCMFSAVYCVSSVFDVIRLTQPTKTKKIERKVGNRNPASLPMTGTPRN